MSSMELASGVVVPIPNCANAGDKLIIANENSNR